MTAQTERWRELRKLDEWLETPMLLLSLGWLAIVVVELTSGTSDLLATIGTVIWVIFILEFALRFTLAPEKLPFLKSSWLTIISLIVPALRLFRAFAVFRAARALRGIRLVDRRYREPQHERLEGDAPAAAVWIRGGAHSAGARAWRCRNAEL